MADPSFSLSLLQSNLRAASLRATIIAFVSAAVVVGSLGYATVTLRKDEQTIVRLKGTIKELQQAGAESTTTGQDKINALQGLLQQAQGEIATLKAAGTGTQGENATLSNELNDAQGKNTTLTNALNDAQGKNTTLTGQLNDANNKIQQLQATVVQDNQRIQQLQATVDQDNQRIQQLQNAPPAICPSNGDVIQRLQREIAVLQRTCHRPPVVNPG